MKIYDIHAVVEAIRWQGIWYAIWFYGWRNAFAIFVATRIIAHTKVAQ